jgi:hypothetical protein
MNVELQLTPAAPRITPRNPRRETLMERSRRIYEADVARNGGYVHFEGPLF